MKNFFVKLLCAFVPPKQLRQNIRDRYMISKKNRKNVGIVQLLRSIKSKSVKPYKRLEAQEWSRAHDKDIADLKDKITNDSFLNEWTLELERLTKVGDSVIEIGCALGASSLYLAKRGRIITGLDYSQEMCDVFIEIASSLGLQTEAVCADITKVLPIKDNAFDIVWHAGLIEHFSDNEVQHITNECARIAKHKVISMCPNANSLAYRIGKEFCEKNGTWQAGEENPKYTLKDIFIKSGLKNVYEYSIDLDFALGFLPYSELRDKLMQIYKNLPTSDNCNQGYLLVTVGEK